MEAGWQGEYVGAAALRAAGIDLLQHAQDHDLRRLATKCSATSSRRRSRAETAELHEQEIKRHGLRFLRRPGTTARRGAQVGRQGLRLRAPPRHREGRRLRPRAPMANSPSWAWPASTSPKTHGGMGMGPVEGMVVMEELGRGIVLEPLAQTLIAGGILSGYADDAVKSAWLPQDRGRRGAGGAGPAGAQGALPARRLRSQARTQAGNALDGHRHQERRAGRRQGRCLPGAGAASTARSRCSWSSAAPPASPRAATAPRTAAAPPK